MDLVIRVHAYLYHHDDNLKELPFPEFEYRISSSFDFPDHSGEIKYSVKDPAFYIDIDRYRLLEIQIRKTIDKFYKDMNADIRRENSAFKS